MRRSLGFYLNVVFAVLAVSFPLLLKIWLDMCPELPCDNVCFCPPPPWETKIDCKILTAALTAIMIALFLRAVFFLAEHIPIPEWLE